MRIPVKLRLITPLREIKDELANYPNFRLLRNGTALKYNLVGYGDQVTYNMEISRNSLVLETLCDESPLYDVRHSLNIVLGVCTMLKGHISMDFGSIMPYVAYELNKESIANYANMANETDQNPSYLVLARRINNLLSENRELKVSLESAEEEVSKLVSYILIFEGLHRTVSFAEVAERYKFEGSKLEAISGNLQSYGYRAVRVGKDRFTVVGI